MTKLRTPTRVVAKKPLSPLLKPVKLEYAKFFKALLNGTKSLVTQDWPKVVSDVMDGAAALNLATTPAELAHTLLQRSITKALFDVVGETSLRMLIEKADAENSIDQVIENTLGGQPLTIDRHFFDRPTSLEILPPLQETIKLWLVAYGVSEAASQNISKRLPSYFQAAVMEEWKAHSSRYAPILEVLNSPFAKAGDREIGWKNYDAYLQQQIERSVFDEAFSLAQIYIPLNGYYLEPRKDGTKEADIQLQNEERRRVVVALEQELLSWVEHPHKDDLLRVISGGPGSGKSTFARIFAAKVSKSEAARVLFIELHKLDATKDLPGEISRYVRDEGLLAFDPLDPDNPEPNLLVILDGLDELASQGRAAAETARAFVGEVERTLRRKNEREIRLRVLLSGRELVVQENESEFRGPKQVISLLAYCLTDEEGRHRNEQVYTDPEKLLARDLRQDWWKIYGELTGNEGISGLPEALDREGLHEVTAQPLLNYLVALSFTRGKVKFDQSVNLNLVYADLVEAVYERGYDKNRRHVSISHLTFEEFQRVLEEVALAAWHGDGRSTTVREIQEHCRVSNLGALLEKFQEGASAGVTRLLAAFFFRQYGERASTGDRTFIFTHKSFGEFLTACRIVRAAGRIVKQLEVRKQSFEEGWNEREALSHWAAVCGPSACTGYIRDFIHGEFRRRPGTAVDTCRNVLADLFSHLLGHGMPMEKLGLKTFPEALYQSRNAEEALLVALSATAVVSETVAYIRQPETQPTAFGAWFRRIQGQRTSRESCLAASSLSFIGLPNAVFDIADFYNSNFAHSDLSGLVAHYGNFGMCNLFGANLAKANLRWATFDDAQLREADLRGADLGNASFSVRDRGSADLNGANLTKAILTGANLTNADLSGANLANANLSGAKLTHAKLEGAKLEGAKMPVQWTKRRRLSGPPRSTKP
jgi:uncharacterized protein YjbI with pentapeptide repeats